MEVFADGSEIERLIPAEVRDAEATAEVEVARRHRALLGQPQRQINRLALRIAGLLSLSLRASFILSSPLEKRGEVPRLRLKSGIAI